MEILFKPNPFSVSLHKACLFQFWHDPNHEKLFPENRLREEVQGRRLHRLSSGPRPHRRHRSRQA